MFAKSACGRFGDAGDSEYRYSACTRHGHVSGRTNRQPIPLQASNRKRGKHQYSRVCRMARLGVRRLTSSKNPSAISEPALKVCASLQAIQSMPWHLLSGEVVTKRQLEEYLALSRDPALQPRSSANSRYGSPAGRTAAWRAAMRGPGCHMMSKARCPPRARLHGQTRDRWPAPAPAASPGGRACGHGSVSTAGSQRKRVPGIWQPANLLEGLPQRCGRLQLHAGIPLVQEGTADDCILEVRGLRVQAPGCVSDSLMRPSDSLTGRAPPVR